MFPAGSVLDNLKSGIVEAALHDPVVQRSYREFAEHYGFLISPCRVRTPEHKGKVESGVHYVKRNFLAARPPMTLTRANQELLVWVNEVAGQRIHGTTQKRPLEVFESVERAALEPLPATPYDLGVWKRVKLHRDCHVVFAKAFYSAPHRLIGKQLWVRSNGREVVLFHEYERVATHPHAAPGERRTLRDHYPPEKAMYLIATPDWCRSRAAEIGPSCSEAIEQLLSERPLDRLRAVQAILRLTERYSPERLEKACQRALHFGDVRKITIERILKKGLEAEALPELGVAQSTQLQFKYARSGSEIFS